MTFLLYGFIIASMILYGNTITIIKKIKDDKDFSGNLLFGILLVGFIAFSLLNFL
ncbi:hypothetical protein [Maledivibacter halophilus]|uniref:Uncharacterized protein n=1 Tax=Maledivibacter halophilus TaxID=36842 RepID=A0A1T5KFJ0_9FIRM|nr:hypothetical protein [Maledivibacter halophilus]SKC62185.1 hypothetical protein SAMN02194393_01741 [Maledivibacter halophilus]